MLIYKGKIYKTRKDLVLEIGKAKYNKLIKYKDDRLEIIDESELNMNVELKNMDSHEHRISK